MISASPDPDHTIKDPSQFEIKVTGGSESDDLTAEERRELNLARILADVREHEHQHWEVDGEFSRTNGFEAPFHPR